MATGPAFKSPPIGSRTLVRRSSGEQAAFYIRQLIFDGVLRPGQRVPQDDIAAALGVSRIPLREALIVLEREGWVTIEIHRGAFVNALSPEAVHDHFELFGVIYGFAVHRAMERSGDEFVQHMVRLQADLAAANDPTKAVEFSSAIYRCIVDSARSPRLRIILEAISTLVPGDFFEAVPTAVEVERKSLAAMVRALRRGDADKAADEFARMLRQVSRQVTGLLEERGLFEMPAEPD